MILFFFSFFFFSSQPSGLPGELTVYALSGVGPFGVCCPLVIYKLSMNHWGMELCINYNPGLTLNYFTPRSVNLRSDERFRTHTVSKGQGEGGGGYCKINI